MQRSPVPHPAAWAMPVNEPQSEADLAIEYFAFMVRAYRKSQVGGALHEMLTGRRLFGSESVSEILVSVLMAELDLKQLPANTPA